MNGVTPIADLTPVVSAETNADGSGSILPLPEPPTTIATQGGDSVVEHNAQTLRDSYRRRSSSMSLRRNTTVGNDGAALPSAFYCPLTLSVMRDPVIDRDGNSYERHAIEHWLSRECTSPITRKPLRYKDLSPNRSLKEAIAERMGVDWTLLASCSDVSLVDAEATSSTALAGHGHVRGDDHDGNEVDRNGGSAGGVLRDGFASEPRRMVSSFLQEISRTVGKRITLNPSGICAFTYETFTIVVEVPASVRSFFIYTEMIDDVRARPAPELIMERALRLNYLQQETRGGCLSLDGRKLVFSYTDRVDEIDASDFRNILENFIDSAMRLHGVLEDAAHPEDGLREGATMMDGDSGSASARLRSSARMFHRSESC